ncbi:hypothetical protein QR680_002823 [Steinernema hermaphroditum]|uniref:Uncharacterized protein n=1 Tax=Steinernema hermaphroditum TaxID=289476 RepID=A0AA39LIV7_9BILA|nr:hypothetical protein QR680_002823 [Steinernema hermaphroditum]
METSLSTRNPTSPYSDQQKSHQTPASTSSYSTNLPRRENILPPMKHCGELEKCYESATSPLIPTCERNTTRNNAVHSMRLPTTGMFSRTVHLF